MSNSVTFHHLFTGKKITVQNKSDVIAIMHGNATVKEKDSNGVECVFILLEKIPPMPIVETEEQALALLGLDKEKT